MRFLLLLLLLATLLVNAQTDTAWFRKSYTNNAIHLSAFHYSKGLKKFKRSQLKNEFEEFYEAKSVYKLHKRDQRLGILGIGISGSLLCLSTYFGNKSFHTAAKYAEIASWIPPGFTVYFLIRGKRRLNYAIWLRNRDAILSEY
jgi:hypothetical protein